MLQGLAQRSDNGSSSGSVISIEVERTPPMQSVSAAEAYQKKGRAGSGELLTGTWRILR